MRSSLLPSPSSRTLPSTQRTQCINYLYDIITILLHIGQHGYWYYVANHYHKAGHISIAKILITILVYGNVFAMGLFVFIKYFIKNFEFDTLTVLPSFYIPTAILAFYTQYISSDEYDINQYLDAYNATYITLLWQHLILGLPITVAQIGYMVIAKQNDTIIIISVIVFIVNILLTQPIIAHVNKAILKKITIYYTIDFILQLIRCVFTIYLIFFMLITDNYKDDAFSSNTIVKYCFLFYTAKFVIITPLFVIWSLIWISFNEYTIDWFWIKSFRKHGMTAILGIFLVPFIICLVLVYLIAFYIMLELCFFSMGHFMIICNEQPQDYDYTKDDKNGYNYLSISSAEKNEKGLLSTFDVIAKWKVFYSFYVNHRHNERLGSLYILNHFCLSCVPEEHNNIKQSNIESTLQMYIMNEKITDNIKINGKSMSVWKNLLFGYFNCLRWIATYLEIAEFYSVRSDKLFNIFNNDDKSFEFQCTGFFGNIWELIGLFVIFPIYIISNVVVTIAIPIVLLVMYFYVHTDLYKLWIIYIYLFFLLIFIVLFVPYLRVMIFWSKCEFKGSIRYIRNIRDLYRYQKALHDFRFVMAKINELFVSEIADEILQFMGMVSRNGHMVKIMIPTIQDLDKKRATSSIDYNYVVKSTYEQPSSNSVNYLLN